MLRVGSLKCSNNFHRIFRTAKCTYHAGGGCYGYRPKKKIVFGDDVDIIHNRIKYSNLFRLITAYRKHGHQKANINPLDTVARRNNERSELTELNLDHYGLHNVNLNSKVKLTGLMHVDKLEEATYGDILKHLEKAYCGALSVELSHLQNEKEKLWFADLVEQSIHWGLDSVRQKHLAKLLLRSQVFDNFLAKKFPTVKRYGGEGAESMMVFFDELFLQASKGGLEQVVIGMPHRGRLNLLTGLMKYPIRMMFSKMMGNSELPSSSKASGDVLSHLSNSVDIELGEESPLHVTMIPNPSHLEANSPVAIGKARGKQMTYKWNDYSEDDTNPKVLCVLAHGDASFIGQGIISETLGMSSLPHYDIGGTIHFIVNNQLGFTTPSHRGRSSLYASDIAKMIDCPVLHVNGDYPEEVARACKLALEYKLEFKKDVLIDLNCYRRWGHNELDDPSFTQPSMYSVISGRKSVPDSYAEYLEELGVVTHDVLKEDVAGYNTILNDEYKHIDAVEPEPFHLQKLWSGMVEANDNKVTSWDTGLMLETLMYIGSKSVELPGDFNVHPHLKKTQIDARLNKLKDGTAIDWATAEAMAIGSLIFQGFNVRLSGQDVGRGTFSHRHAMFVDQKTDEIYIPINNIKENQTGFLEVCNSHLSEEAVLGFEYGMSIQNPNHLIIWEAQFGDFFNGAQIIIDTFISSGETKWLMQSGLVMLLPHGYDGAGPEHSSCRIERFLQLTDSKEDAMDGDNVNMHIVNPTTPAQYFHLLRQQMLRNFRKSLVVVAPKMLLRMPAAMSNLSEMGPGTHFLSVLGDPSVNGTDVRRVVFCSGKHYYALARRRDELKAKDTAIIRLEALTPFPADVIKDELKKYPAAKEFVWSQEEHRNMGAWTFVAPRFKNILGIQLNYVGRKVLAAPAVGIGKLHSQEAAQVLQETFPIK
ncbi:probable 2-oxoglutarate dehydrogenase E1 component DHKTD1, mitochondrial [Actinia tenebrosa]|uniref:Probable 2-oxoglutarate dehydrogenase E1 component DHKTD1, mitochondrial n=1 Tax=Actinia tenebrosa TaxID=6105 RepID=A0A6P8H766_ACTTE|nr:probable 2-oxoglutarate dehydrogenase E1 component DHKTD1, mitochondrial [Actinia tenebrosa]